MFLEKLEIENSVERNKIRDLWDIYTCRIHVITVTLYYTLVIVFQISCVIRLKANSIEGMKLF